MHVETLTDEQFAAEVARLCALGKSQDQIGTELGLTKWQVRHRLFLGGYRWKAGGLFVEETKTGRKVKPPVEVGS